MVSDNFFSLQKYTIIDFFYWFHRYAKVPEDEPFEIHPATDSEESDSESESETDDSEDERQRKLMQLQEQLREVQEQIKVGNSFAMLTWIFI